jgi:hypothetical protein
MNAGRPAEESPLRAYTRLLLRLHELIAAGKGDTANADAVRDEMDAPWRSLGSAEQELAGGLSEDLYAISDHGPRAVAMTTQVRSTWGRDCVAVHASSL